MCPTARRSRAIVAVLAVLALLAACGSDGDAVADDATADEPAAGITSVDDAFPVTIEHALGTAEIPERPERVVTWGWGSTDAAIALGVVPVAMPHQAYGGDGQGVLPWIRDRVEADGAELPEVLPQTDEAPIEAIAAARPDVIIAVYSGLTQEEHDLLSEIAPVVAYPDQPWATPWRDTVELVGEALGRPDEATALLEEIDAEVAAQAEAHPELAGQTVAAVWDTGDAFYVYKPADARVGFLLELGLEGAPSVDELAAGGESFYYTLSHERAAELTSDILVAYADTPDQMDAFLASPSARSMAQVRDGRVAPVVGTELIAAVSPPTALSLTWGLDEYVEILAGAAR
ncbi:MAG TPA: ABC transporter substrate-binding protein [Acidimicrobiales bacterium]|nr:ABC transporter substrate-binding protein [Acidimicrobiales bacterium]